MKVLSVFAVSALALVCSVDHATGAACTVDDVEKTVPLLDKIVADENCLKTKNGECPNAECLKTLASLTEDMPDCTSEGKNVKSEYAAQIKKCSSGSSAAASFSTSAAVALSSAAVTIAAVYL